MKFKEFISWCSDRASDGMWTSNTALVCMEAARYVHGKPFWKREKVWQQYNEDWKIVEILVNGTNGLIESALSERSNKHG